MTRKEVIEDLNFLKQVLKKHYKINPPVCIDYAMDYLKSAEAVKEVITTEEEDFYTDLPFWMKEEDPNVQL